MLRTLLALALLTLITAGSVAAQELRLPPQLLPVPEELRTVRPITEAPVAFFGDDVAYGEMFYFTQNAYWLATFAASNPAVLQNLLQMTAFSYAGTWVPDEGGGPGSLYELALIESVWYVLRRNLVTYEAEMLAEAPLSSEMGWSGMAYSVALGALFAVATDCAGLTRLYQIDIETGAQTLLTAFTTAAICAVSFAIGLETWGLVLDNELDQLFRIDLAALTMTALAVGLGFDAAYAQGMGFSYPLGRFFAGTVRSATRAEAGGPVGELRVADVDGEGNLTGAMSLAGEIGGGVVEPLYLTFLGTGTTSAEPEGAAPTSHVLSDVYPNPFAGEAHFTLRPTSTEYVRVDVYDVLGRRVARLHEGVLPGGVTHPFYFDAGVLPGGTYIIRVEGETFRTMRQVTLAR